MSSATNVLMEATLREVWRESITVSLGVNEVIKGSLLTQHEQGRFQRGQLVLERLKLKFEIKSLCLGLLKRVIQHLRATTSLYAPIHMGQPRRVKTKTLQCGAALCDVVAVVLGQVAPTSGA
ncbi:uncharacterized protein G2W53_001965 [Senna tora]|uniref:Uncharacterized protein n=1 Tax=Senna tora TaxID=362788 RepID=A0A834XIG3_9FABA|nr:uncharacterized protein G2W53_001965 [Senna tora]